MFSVLCASFLLKWWAVVSSLYNIAKHHDHLMAHTQFVM